MDLEDDLEVCQVLAQRELRRLENVVRQHCSGLQSLLTKDDWLCPTQINQVIYSCQRPADGVVPTYLVKTGSPTFDKIVLSITSVCIELEVLAAESSFIRDIYVYGDDGGSPEVQLSHFLPVLRRLGDYVARCGDAIQLALRQVVGFFSFAPHNDGINVHVVFGSLSQLLATLASLDLVINQQSLLRDHIASYLRLLKSVKYQHHLGEQIKVLFKLVSDIDAELLQGNILRSCVSRKQETSLQLLEAVKTFLRSELSSLENDLSKGFPQVYQKVPRFVALCAFFVLYASLVGNQSDRKIFRAICDLSKRVGPVYVVAGAKGVWTAADFFQQEIPHLGKLVPVVDRAIHLEQLLNRLPNEVTTLEAQVSLWILKVDTITTIKVTTEDVMDELQDQSSILLQGLNLARCLSQQLQLLVGLHLFLERAVARTSVVSICRMLAALSALRAAVALYGSRLDGMVQNVEQHLRYQLLQIVGLSRKRLESEKKDTPKKLDANASVTLSQLCLRGPLTQMKRICLRFSLEYVIQVKAMRPHDLLLYNEALEKLESISNFTAELEKACDVWGLSTDCRTILEVFLTQLYSNNSPVTPEVLPYVLMSIVKGSDSTSQKGVFEVLRKCIVEPLCKDIETDLRIQMHSHLVTDAQNPFQQTRPQPSAQLKRLIFLESLALPAELVSLKRCVEQYLEKTFYNLTTVALHDWRTYDEMRAIARLKFSLNTVESHLPTETIDQGLDVLTVMRNIQDFAARFAYNMNTQTFIERTSPNKHLTTINIGHIANSIRTHGPGITDTTVNVVYKYLKRQFTMLSQFLYDEHIRSRLTREITSFQNERHGLQQKYPLEKAEKIRKVIRKLGATNEGHLYLDRVRQLFTWYNLRFY